MNRQFPDFYHKKNTNQTSPASEKFKTPDSGDMEGILRFSEKNSLTQPKKRVSFNEKVKMFEFGSEEMINSDKSTTTDETDIKIDSPTE